MIPSKDADYDENIMDEVPIFNISKEELQRHALEISSYSKVTKKTNCIRKLINNLDKSYKKILEVHDYLDKETKNKNEVLQASEWLLDNLYLVQKEYKDIKANMPEDYYKNLPVMSKGIMKGYPRAYYIAVELVSHVDGRIDEKTIKTFINAYQNNIILTSGELWALPIMIRIALIQNISKISDRIVFAQKEGKKGDKIAEGIIDSAAAGKIEEEIERLMEQQTVFTPQLVERLTKVLRDNGIENPFIYKWIDEHLEAEETNTENMISIEHQRQISYQISMGNCITSIREVGAINWKESFEELSYVERVLRKDPAKVYENMDFESRDYYRHGIEKLAKYMGLPESFIARKAIECTQEAVSSENSRDYEKHVGYYIIDKGSKCLRKRIGFKEKKLRYIFLNDMKENVNIYIGAIIVGTALLMLLILQLNFYDNTTAKLWEYLITTVAILIPSSEVIISIFNWSITKLIEPKFIPKIEFKNTLPEKYSAAVVIPTLLNDEARVKELIADLEVYYLANEEKNLYYALLGDFKDSSKEQEESDKGIVETALSTIKALNSKYAKEGKDIFYFFNRYRQYNEKEGIWLGWERKRGKLMEFNALIRGDKNTSYNVISGDISNLFKVKYIITLDADTKLPRGSAKKLIGAMTHTLNIPYVDEKSKRVVRGHGLMQPRVSVGIQSANKTMFSKIFSGETGIDRYTSAISDVYQDLFEEGIFTGKGIYDVDVFTNILKDEIPENIVLSHDLLEGSYVRAGLVTDIELVDGYPAYYNSSCKRLHRWVRGDWQILPWIFKKTALNRLSKWKIVDNLRRSLLAPSIIILVILALLNFSDTDTLLVVAFISLLCPILFDVSEAVVSPIKGISLSGTVNSGKNAIEQFFLIFCFLPYQAYLMLDAIIRTVYRLTVSKKNLLQWQTAADAEASSGKSLKNYVESMWEGSAISIIIVLIAFQSSVETGVLMIPSCTIWFLSPWIAYSISRDRKVIKEALNNDQYTVLRRLSRKTWAYFEDFVIDENNWLAPDNYQEDPNKGVAPRTSPTNMGMGLTSNLAAYDLGYIGILDFTDRIDKIIENMESLEKYNGHFYNWYDTRSKSPLFPRYVSTVDSGNLVGYLWLVEQTLTELLESPIINSKLRDGLMDTIKIAEEELSIEGESDYYSSIIKEIYNNDFNIVSLKRLLLNLLKKASEIEKNKEASDIKVEKIKDNSTAEVEKSKSSSEEKTEKNKKSSDIYWNIKLKKDVNTHLKDIETFFPWIDRVADSSNSTDIYEEVQKLNKMAFKISIKDINKELENIYIKFNNGLMKVNNTVMNTQVSKTIYLNNALEEEANELSIQDEMLSNIEANNKSKKFGNKNTNIYNKNVEFNNVSKEAGKEKKENITISDFLINSKNEIDNIINKIEELKRRLKNIADNTNFRMLYNEKRQLFSIGYDVERDSLGNSYYDLLASEARAASFIAIAKGDIDEMHWFRLGRAITSIDGNKALVSWSGTMFEYFMPLIIMKSYPNTLLEETYRAVVELQKKYCRDRNVPWGISESAFYYFDVSLNYQYKAFGVPGLGLKRGLINELVISPYSSVMALQIDLKGALSNLNTLISLGMEGRYGLYEAIDYTKERMQKGKKEAIIKSFMVHHEGMSLMALNNVLRDNIFQKRFHRIPRIKAAELLLQEKVPKAIVYDREQQYESIEVDGGKQSLVVRRYTSPNTEVPETHLMSNGSYSFMITNSGSGYGKVGDMMAYRWREDVTRDNTGMFFYIKNLNSNEYWSSSFEPCRCEGEEYETIFSLDKVEFRRKDGNLRTHTELTVSSEDNVEIRRISITNNSDHVRDVEITSYCEVTLAPYNADLVHPTFSNLFIKTEYLDELGCIIAYRRPRAKGQKRPWIMQTLAVDGSAIGPIQYETNRANFVGRGRNLSNPQAMDNDAQLKMTVGAVLDPIISMRVRIKLKKGETCTIAYTTAVSDSREEIIELAKKYRNMGNISRAFELSWTTIQVEMKYLGIKSAQANIYQMMASKIIFLNPLLKKRDNYIINIQKGQSALWAYGISGDLPIVLLIVTEEKHKDLVRQILSAHEYLSIKGLKVDLVILNLQGNSYVQPMQDIIRDLISSSTARDKQNKSGGVFLYDKVTMSQEDINLLMAISRLVIHGDKGSLLSQLEVNEESYEKEDKGELLLLKRKEHNYASHKYDIPQMEYFNGIGGFNKENNSYVIILKDYEDTPAPWINVISNKNFGFHVSENGIAYTWNKNSRENKLTTWSNDPVMDSEAEEVYIRDEITGECWSVSPKPIRDGGEYIIEHGFGYSTFKHEAFGISGEMTMFTDMAESLKLCRVKLKNNTEEERKLSLSYYAKLVLGVTHEQTAQYIFTGFNSESEYIYAKNPYSEHFGNLICYMKIFGGQHISFTGNRKEFIGRGGSAEHPRMLKIKNLSNTIGAGYDPCLAENVKFDLNVGEEKELLIIFGQEENFESIKRVIDKYESQNKAGEELNNTKRYWRDMLSTIQVETPDKSMDILINGWLMYQVISCRFWSRTAFYQSGGAYGFRDQLQDVMAISYLEPSITREYIIYSASKQYVEGDVQHWWHPIVESGIRTRFSDDLLWLPYVTIDYIQNTGDFSILEEKAGYLEDEELKEGEDERYNIARKSDKKGTIYEHCIKAIERSLKFGPHNIPLMGSGDWNDGMSTVGNKGRGESVWLGWFLYSILDKFINLCNFKQDKEKAEKYRDVKEFIRENLEKNAWDGGWYRRAYFDDGTPLGSLQNDECQIDSLSQSWAVISGAAKESRTKEAMEALQRNLIKEDKGIVLLLTPAFDKSLLEPGYIKGYVPGVRENGGQYTHGSIWVILALAKMGYNNKAWRIFNMINPINHSRSYLNAQVYKVEPYVMTADVYAVEPHTGRGGWSWYTGAAGWMYRTGIEGILGFKFKGKEGFTIEPCVPNDWQEYSINYTRHNCKYNIKVNRGAEKGTWLDDTKLENEIIPFLDEGEHEVKVVI
jgi:cellobiose phosphorylase